MAHCQHAPSRVKDFALGFTSFLEGVKLAVQVPRVRWTTLGSLLLLTLSCGISALILFLVAIPSRYAVAGILYKLDKDTQHVHEALSLASIWWKSLNVLPFVILLLARGIAPQLSGGSFWAMFSVCDPALEERLRKERVIYGLRQLLCHLVIVIVVIVLLVLFAPLAGPALIAAVPLALPILLGTLAGTVGLGALCGILCGKCVIHCNLWRQVNRLDPMLGFFLVLGLFISLFRGQVVRWLWFAVQMYLKSMLLTSQLLAQYRIRKPAKEWNDFYTRHSWSLLGFGLWLCLAYEWPFVGLIMLDVFHAAAAKLLHRLLMQDQLQTQALGDDILSLTMNFKKE